MSKADEVNEKGRRHHFNNEDLVVLSVAERSFVNFYEQIMANEPIDEMVIKKFLTMPDGYKLPETETAPRTTLMLRNIPSKFDQESLISTLQERGFIACTHFDFVYLPIDLRTRKNLGYAFINFKTYHIADDFTRRLSNVKLRAQSEKLLQIGYAKLQGFQQNCDLFATSASVATMPGCFQPLAFSESAGRLVPLSALLNLFNVATPTSPGDTEPVTGLDRLVKTTWSLLGNH
jgi:RNA recognition motif 2